MGRTDNATNSHTLGIDLASRPENTAICLIGWSPGQARVTTLAKGRNDDGEPLDDRRLLEAMVGAGDLREPTKIAIDAPLGWPVDFVDAVSDLDHWPVGLDQSRDRLLRRATDQWIHANFEKLPLSVTSDRIAYPAMRASALLVAYAAETHGRIDRSGMTGPICEAYPNPAIREFLFAGGNWDGRYKRANQTGREVILEALARDAPWLELSPHHRAVCEESDDCLDALVCALVARAAELGLTGLPDDDHVAEAQREGWIHIPTRDALDTLTS